MSEYYGDARGRDAGPTSDDAQNAPVENSVRALIPTVPATPQEVDVIPATTGDDVIHAHPGGSYIDGLAGNDLLIGDIGNDHLIGGIGNDELTGGDGSDWEEGGEGNDFIHDAAGSDRLDGGAGDDHIIASGQQSLDPVTDTLTITGGDGNDYVEFYATFDIPYTERQNLRNLTGTIDLGAGNDRLYLDSSRISPVVTLGAGQDRIFFGTHRVHDITVTDFQAGDTGDSIDIAKLVYGFQGYVDGANPFVDGYVRLVQDGADTLIQTDYDGNGPGGGSGYVSNVLRLVGVTATSLTAFNLGGYAPTGGAIVGFTINGTANADTLDGMAGNDIINGLGGDDHITGGNGNDTIDGGIGNDTIDGGRGNDTLTGGDGNDVLQDIDAGSDKFYGGDGDDVITVSHTYQSQSEVGLIDAGAGNDKVYWQAGGGVSPINLGAGDDYLYLRTAPGAGSTITLGAGVDKVELYGGITSQDPYNPVVLNDFATGDSGDVLDWLAVARQWSQNYSDPNYNPFATGLTKMVQNGADVELQISDGFQTKTLVVFRNTTVAAFTVHNLGVDSHVAPPLSTVDTITGTSGDDHLTGTADRDVISGMAGNDVIDALGGNDLLHGNAGNDTINGGAGDDIITGDTGADVLNGGDGNDTIVELNGGDDLVGGNDIINGGDGDDVIGVRTTYDFTGSFPVGSLDAGAGNDTVTVIGEATPTPYTINLGSGDDRLTLKALMGDETITLGTGVDTIILPAYYQTYIGAKGTITDFTPGAGGDQMDLGGYVDWFLNMYNRGGTYTLASGYNPFAAGTLELRQNGANVDLWLHPDGATGGGNDQILFRFNNTTVGQFTAYNFGGFAPVASQNDVRIITTSTTIAAGTTEAGDNFSTFLLARPHFVFQPQAAGVSFVNNGTITTTTNIAAGGDLVGFMVSQYANVTADTVFRNGTTGHFSVVNTWMDSAPRSHLNYITTTGFAGGNGSPIFINDGDFRVSAEYGLALGVANGSNYYNHAPTTNNGTMTITGGYDATAFEMAPYSDLTNTGTITVTAGNDAIGVERREGGQFRNDGTVTVTGGQTATGMLSYDFKGGGFVNTGTIRATTDIGSPYLSVGLFIGQNSGWQTPSEIVNSGTIQADFAIYVSPKFGVGTVYASTEKLTNSGTITGDIDLSYGDDIIVNTGHITGFVELGQGNDSYDGSNGHLAGIVDGGTGDDKIAGGADDDILFGGLGRDSISGGAGDDTIFGGDGQDALDGGAGFDTLSYLDMGGAMLIDLAAGTATLTDGAGHAIETDLIRNFEAVVGAGSDDVIRGAAGNETLDGNAGNDVIDGRAGNDVIIGGTGDDTLTGGAGNDDFRFFKGDGKDTVTDFSAGDVIHVQGYATYTSLTQEGSDLRIVLSPTDSILLKNTTAAAITGGNLIFDPSTPAPEPLTPPHDPTILNDTTVIPVGTVWTIADTALGLDRFAGYYDVAITLQPATGSSPYLFNGGSITAHPGYDVPFLVGITRGDPIMVGGNYGNGDSNVVNLATGKIDIVNQNGDVSGVRGTGEGWNAGTFHVQAVHGNATGFDYLGGLVHNSGTLSVQASGTATGIYAPNFGFFNSGAITVSGGAASYGVNLTLNVHPALPPVEFANRGTITVTDTTAAMDSVGVKYELMGVAHFWNSGTIKADYALFTTSANPGDFTVYNSGTLDGRVHMATVADHLFNTGTITGLVELDTGDDVFDGRNGKTLGEVHGDAGNDILIGGSFADKLVGGDGNDTITGGAGNDILTGGQGVDTFHVETGFGADEITDFTAGAGGDVISVTGYAAYQSIVQQGADALVTFAAGDTILLRGVQAGNVTAANFQFGAAALAAQVIPAAPTDGSVPQPPDLGYIGTRFLPTIGTDGNDVLGQNGIGPDSFYGGKGNDTYYVDQLADLFGHGDIVFENANEGTDTVISTSNYYLYANVENLTLASGAGNIFGVGNELANTIAGNEGANTLLAGAGADIVHGGAGVDIIYGEAGNDQLFGDADNDFLAGGDGDDVIDGGTGGDALYGEAGNDTLTGGSDFVFDQLVGGAGNDILHGDSGLSDYDYLYGNTGDDSFYVDTGDDLTFEQAGEGTDTVYANVPGANNGVYLYANVENLVLLGTTTFGVGNGLANQLTGNASVNLLLGGDGNDIINGKGGNDVLFGQGGADTFVFEHGTGGDVIGDFVAGTDKIDLVAIGYTWAQVQNSFHQNGSDLAIDLGGGDLIVLQGVNASQLHQSDFILASGSAAVVPVESATVVPTPPAATDHAAMLHHLWHGADAALLTPLF